MTERFEQKELSEEKESFSSFLPDIGEYLSIIRRSWLLMASSFVVVVTLGVIYTIKQPKIYEAAATIILKAQAIRPLGSKVETIDQSATNYWFLIEFRKTQLKVITSKTVLQKVIDKLHLGKDLDFLGLKELPTEEREDALKKIDPSLILADRVKANVIRDSELVEIRVTDKSPFRAALIANTIVASYKEYLQESKLQMSSFAIRWLDEQAENLREQLHSAENRLYEFLKKNEIEATSFEARKEAITEQLSQLTRDYNTLRSEAWKITTQLKELNNLHKTLDRTSFETLVQQDEILKRVSEKVFALEQEMIGVASDYGPKHPKYKRVQTELEGAKATLAEELNKLLDAKKKQKDMLTALMEKHEKGIAELKKEAMHLNRASIEYQRLQNEIENFRNLYALVLNRSKETQISDISQFSEVQVVEEAAEPEAPVSPQTRLNILFSLFIGFLASVFSVLIKEKIDNKIKNIDEAERIIQRPFFGVIPNIKLGEESLQKANGGGKVINEYSKIALYSYYYPKSTITEAIRFIRTNIVFSSPSKPHTILLFTSSLMQEGKTTVANFVATSLASIGKKVIIIDCDLRRPMVHKIYDVSREKGLTTWIVDETVELSDIISGTEIQNLDVISCGPLPPDPSEHILSKRFEELLGLLESRYDYVLLDSPPVSAVSDALLLVKYCHGTVLVVKPSICDRFSLRDSVKKFNRISTPILGFVFNNIEKSGRKYYYYSSGSYYYYSYGSYYSEGERRE
ncbi:MAG: polysaccharide biosynthesis tyrosine autokinase [Myxococcota bacterium]